MDELIMKLPGYRTQLEELDKSLSTPEVMGDMKKYKEKMMERSHLAPIVEKLEEMEKLSGELADSEEMLKSESDGEMMEIIKDEIEELKAKLQEAEKECKVLLVPPDPLEEHNHGDQGRNRRRGSSPLRCRHLQNVYPLRREEKVEDRDHEPERNRKGWIQGNRLLHQR